MENRTRSYKNLPLTERDAFPFPSSRDSSSSSATLKRGFLPKLNEQIKMTPRHQFHDTKDVTQLVHDLQSKIEQMDGKILTMKARYD